MKKKLSYYFSGLSRQVLTWFLILSLVPLSVISWLSYQRGYDQLYKNISESMQNIAVLQTKQIRDNFKRMVIDLNLESERQSNSKLLLSLINSHQLSGKSIAKFVKSYPWTIAVEEHASELQKFWDSYGYHDIFMIDIKGNILFSFRQGPELGSNLFLPELKDTRLSAAAQQSLLSGKTVFSDLEYSSFDDETILIGYLVNILLNDSGEKIGLIAFQLADEKLEKLIGSKSRFGSSGRRYLLGVDLRLRSHGAFDNNYEVLRNAINTPLSTNWINQHTSHLNEDDIENNSSEVSIYTGIDGEPTLGVLNKLDMAGTHWAYISEIHESEAFSESLKLAKLTLAFVILTVILVFFISIPVTQSIVKPIVEISAVLDKLSSGDLNHHIKNASKHELGNLVDGFNSMIDNLRQSQIETATHSWLQDGVSELNSRLQGNQSITNLSKNIINFLCNYLDVKMGAFYIVRTQKIQLIGSYAFSKRKGFRNEFSPGEGLVGQAALEQQSMVMCNIPNDYISISSGLGEATPKTIAVYPLIWNEKVVALLEFASFNALNELHERFIDLSSSAIAIAVQTSLSRDETHELLEQTQAQTEALKFREEELQETNDLLQEQAKNLKKSEDFLKNSQSMMEEKNGQLQEQQQKLEDANEELANRASELKKSKDNVEKNNTELKKAQMQLEKKADDLKLASQYKSEFLANMSHELRTPLNSLLILAKLLADNKSGNLTEKQINYSHTIHDSGSDLLNLINDILDLSKIESGKMEVYDEPILLVDFITGINDKFKPLAENKQISFAIDTKNAPEKWRSDSQKLGQIVKNLISNAIKFTRRGSVELRIYTLTDEETSQYKIAFSIKDSGIGIPENKLKTIFEAFQQVDGTTSRKFGGTGLGLSISKELAQLLNGKILLSSQIDEGSCFTLVLPLSTQFTNSSTSNKSQYDFSTPPSVALDIKQEKPPSQQNTQAKDTESEEIHDDRHTIISSDRSILIIEDDSRFATILKELARERGFKVLTASDGETGLYLADSYQPSGIILDAGLPGIDGWKVLDRLKNKAKTRHIPVQFMSASKISIDSLKSGAIGFLTKPVCLDDMKLAFSQIENVIDRPVKRLLLVEDDTVQSQSIRELIGNGDVDTLVATSGKKALELLNTKHFDCIVLDLGLPDMSGQEILESLRSNESLKKIPVVVYTGRDLNSSERKILDSYAQSIIIKDVRSPERLLDDTSLFLHRVESKMPEARRRTIRMLHQNEVLFEGRKALVVDDDMRNVFALSAALQDKEMEVLVAQNGLEALDKLSTHPDIAIVLMDIMMPEMNGYEATKKIRQLEQFSKLPIIALTAKAMKGDRAQCINAGANDYMAKPINIDKLLSMMRVWLYR